MSLNLVNTGQAAGDGSGDPARTAFQKINSNFLYLETLLNNAAAPIEKNTILMRTWWLISLIMWLD
jgi:hypothetical protein